MIFFKQFNLLIALLLLICSQAAGVYIWAPPLLSTFYYQTSGILNYGVVASIYFINFLNDQAAVGLLKSSGRRVVCNFSIGIYERKTPDSNNIPKYLLSNPVSGMYQASYLNIAGYQTTGLGSVMTARIDLAKSLGCDAVEFDNYDYYQLNSVTGLLLNYQIQLDYFKYLANYAHSVGLAVSLKNNPTQAKDLYNYVDFIFSDICDNSVATCNYMQQYSLSNKAVFGVSYRENYFNYITDSDWQQLCVQYIYQSFSWIVRTTTQDGYHLRCSLSPNSNSNIITSAQSSTTLKPIGFLFLIIFTLLSF